MLDTVDLNCDVGEVSSERDRALLPWVSSCNVSCGVHAGDPVLIADTLREALRLGVAIGAHPSFPDRQEFGRRHLDLPATELAEHLRYQIAAIDGMVRSLGGALHHVKPHGALYHSIAQDAQLAEMVVDIVRQTAPGSLFYGQAETQVAEICADRQIEFVHEAFADRRYENRLKLVPRSQPDAMITDAVALQTQLAALVEGAVVDVQGQRRPLKVQTICLHGDSPQAGEFAKLASQFLRDNHVSVAAP